VASVLDEPGRLLSSEPLRARWVPAGARAWRILYTTTVDEGRPAVASGFVLAPSASASGEEPLPLIAWGHGTTGISPASAPSQLRKGPEAGAFFLTREVIEQGWAIVATDYIGMGPAGIVHPWLIGPPAGRALLDSIRAAHQLPDLTLQNHTVLWGHSQGGHAAIWAGQMAPEYAPELRLAGIAALAPGTDPPAIVAHLDKVFGGNIFIAYTIEAFSSYYRDVTHEQYVRPRSRRLVRKLAARPLGDPRTIVTALTATALRRRIWRTPPDTGPLHARLAENIPRRILTSPLLIAQGTEDEIVPVLSQDKYVADRRRDGHQVDYRTYAGLRHVTLVQRDSPLVGELLAWTHDRFPPSEPR